jgi:hypothetical protein
VHYSKFGCRLAASGQSRRGGRSHTIVYVRFALIATESMRRENPPLRANSDLTRRSKKTLLFDHLVGAAKQRRRHLDAERFCCLEVDYQLELGRLLDRKVGGLLAAQDAIDVGGRLPELVG